MVLEGVSFEIPARGLFALVGPSGAGKTTLFALLERFYDPLEGSIAFAGRDLRAWPRDELRAAIAYVEQEAPVLAGSVRDNLRYAAPGATEEELRAVIATTRLDAFVAGLPDGLDTEIGTRGTTLSGGERQRIAIARALLRSPRLLLLDEASSQLDAVNEAALRAAVAGAAAERAVVAIAHRLSTVVAADRILRHRGRPRARAGHARRAGRGRRALPRARRHAAHRLTGCGPTNVEPVIGAQRRTDRRGARAGSLNAEVQILTRTPALPCAAEGERSEDDGQSKWAVATVLGALLAPGAAQASPGAARQGRQGARGQRPAAAAEGADRAARRPARDDDRERDPPGARRAAHSGRAGELRRRAAPTPGACATG